MNEIVYIIQAGILLVISIYELILIGRYELETRELKKEIKELKIKVKIWKKEALKEKQKY